MWIPLIFLTGDEAAFARAALMWSLEGLGQALSRRALAGHDATRDRESRRPLVTSTRESAYSLAAHPSRSKSARNWPASLQCHFPGDEARVERNANYSMWRIDTANNSNANSSLTGQGFFRTASRDNIFLGPPVRGVASDDDQRN
jgi:hypothetical protein